jgi:DNA-binding beta-propeller fold protein YncE
LVKFQGPLAAALAAALLGAAPHRAASLPVYSSPAGERPAGASLGHPEDAVLPDGRIASPVGATIFVGTNPMGVALSPDGRYAIVSNDEQLTTPPAPLPRGAGAIVPGYSLAVVDTSTMRVTSVYHDPDTSLFIGVASLRDPRAPAQTIVLASDGEHHAVRVFDLADGGTLTPEDDPITVPGYPASIGIGAAGRVAYVSDNLGDTVSAIDIGTRRLLHTASVGYAPFAATQAGNDLLVTNGGFAHYGALNVPVRVPQFANADADEQKSSTLSLVPLSLYGDLELTSGTSVVRMDPIPDGVVDVGGARPGAIVVRRDDEFAYVALSNVDRVSTVQLVPQPRVVGGLDLRLFVDAPYGTQPSAETLSPDGKRLYVALAGLNAVAVLDARNPAQLHRLGLIPTGWYPSALALSRNGRYLYVADAKGVDGWGELQRVDLKHISLIKTTLAALRYNRSVAAAKPDAIVPPLRSNRRSNLIDHVVQISVGSGTFDAIFGDLGRGNADAALSAYAASTTPNLHALAKQYALADNFYVGDMNPDANLDETFGALTLYAQQTLHVNAGRAPYDAHAQDPDDYARAGSLFNQCARAHLTFRDYGALVNLSGYTPGLISMHTGSAGLGGSYTLDVPAPSALAGAIDLNYAGANSGIADLTRAVEFQHDMGALVDAGQEPAFTFVWLPETDGGMADADRAVGQIIEFLSRTPDWSSTAVFITAQDTGGMRDHVNQSRSYALVVSPLAKRGYIGHMHLSPAGVQKTEEELLGLPPLGLPDLLATDMADFFGGVPYPSPYDAIP